jgi:hypothetical protein
VQNKRSTDICGVVLPGRWVMWVDKVDEVDKVRRNAVQSRAKADFG